MNRIPGRAVLPFLQHSLGSRAARVRSDGMIVTEKGRGLHDCNFRIPAPFYGKVRFPLQIRGILVFSYCDLYRLFFRYSIGEQPYRALNARLKWDASKNPVLSAIC